MSSCVCGDTNCPVCGRRFTTAPGAKGRLRRRASLLAGVVAGTLLGVWLVSEAVEVLRDVSDRTV